MTKAATLLALMLWSLPAAAPAFAQEHPLTTPTRDVDVIYLMAGPKEPLPQRLRWGVALGKLRVDPPSPGMFVIIDNASHAMQAVREGDRSVVDLPSPTGGMMPGMAPPGDFTRRGEAQVAGLGCTLWETKDTAGRKVLACLTADGVLLRVEADGLILAEALIVTFAPQPAALFNVPADYRKITSPGASHKRP